MLSRLSKKENMYTSRKGGDRFRSRPPSRFHGGQFKSRRGPKASSIDHTRYVNAALEKAPEEAYAISHNFTDFGLHESLVKNITEHGYTTPTPIQDQAIPGLVEGRDVVGIAQTGSGKTAAFLLPLINKILLDDSQGALILAPTRELALQIADEFRIFTKNLPISMTLCIGGMGIHQQISRLRNNPHVVIGTPGRIKDLIERRAFRPELFTNVVLDEVDRMLDIGFRRDITFLIEQLPEKKQAAFFTATMNRETEQIMHTFLVNPITVSVKKTETSQHIHQDIVPVKKGENKVDILHGLLQKEDYKKVIVFGRTKHGVDKLEKQLFDRGISVSSIHGNKTQSARQRSLDKFKRGQVQALLATDVAARGIDINDVTHVINYDEPQTYEDYIHRIGRTGRAGKTGKALTFVQK